MIGNDVIDLHLSYLESSIDRKGLLVKLFTAREQCFINEASNREWMAWLLWSMKEAVYKIVNRETCRRFYAPLLFICQPDCSIQCGETPGTGFFPSGSVRYRTTLYTAYTCQKNGVLHTIACSSEGKTDAIRSCMADTYTMSHRTELIGSLLLSTPFLFTKNRHGHPFLEHQVSGIQIPASLSHHGRFIAISWMGTY